MHVVRLATRRAGVRRGALSPWNQYSGGEATFTEHHEAHVRVYATERVFGEVRYDTIDEQGSWSGPIGTFGLQSGGPWDGYQFSVSGYSGEVFARFDDGRIGGYTFHRHF